MFYIHYISGYRCVDFITDSSLRDRDKPHLMPLPVTHSVAKLLQINLFLSVY